MSAVTDTPLLRPVIGLEVHAQVLTNSKMFCPCDARYSGAAPNTHVCPICGGMPGALPVINAQALRSTVLAGLALNCEIPRHSKFDRKNYQYPDLPKGYQITQYDMPIAQRGWLEFEVDELKQRCGIIRVHLEEDTGKLLHPEGEGESVSLVDYNRCGVPLMEIVSEPDLDSPAAARQYFAALRKILMYLGVNDGNLQEGSMRADVNVSLRPAGGPEGTKVEIKNLNSFRAVERALEYEIARQRKVLEADETLVQETRGWSERSETTVAQRSKEYAHDYRYFPEPDLPPLHLEKSMVEALRSELPELPDPRMQRFVREYQLSPSTAAVLTDERDMADYFEATLRAASTVRPITAANWITGDVLGFVNERGGRIKEASVSPDRLAGLLKLIAEGVVGGPAAKQTLEAMFETSEDALAIVDRLGLRQIVDTDDLARLVDAALAANPKVVEDYRRGKTKALQALVGKVMAASHGAANAQVVSEMLEKRLH
jgi:aspartyl-tRNA(Asn)/glutamyl-tRNA(Gln) amidotransferase subunit B